LIAVAVNRAAATAQDKSGYGRRDEKAFRLI